MVICIFSVRLLALVETLDFIGSVSAWFWEVFVVRRVKKKNLYVYLEACDLKSINLTLKTQVSWKNWSPTPVNCFFWIKFAQSKGLKKAFFPKLYALKRRSDLLCEEQDSALFTLQSVTKIRGYRFGIQLTGLVMVHNMI